MDGHQMFVTHKICVYLLHLLFVSSAFACNYSLLGDFDTVLRSDNTYLFVGETLTLTCTLSEPCFTVSNVCFWLSHPHNDNKAARAIPASNARVLNGTIAELVISNLTTAYEGQYTCYVALTEYPDCTNMEELRIAGYLEVTVEFSPQKVENFKCVVYNWEESLTCTWTHQVDYVNWSNIDVSLIYIPYVQDPYESSCPNLSNTNCTWDKETVPKASVLAVQVTVNNMWRNVAASVVHDIYMMRVVKPSQVLNLIANKTLDTPGCFLLSWEHARIRRSKVYRICHGTPEEGNFTVLSDNVTETSFLSCGYLPYTKHSFSVECYPTSGYSGYWSDPVYVLEWSRMTEPDLGPQTTNGSFTRGKCVGHLRNVTLMWKDVDLSVRNGIIDGYRISLKQNVLAQVYAQNYSATIELPCDETSEINISAHNKGGYSLRPSVLIIPPDNLTVPEDIASSFAVEILASLSVNNERGSFRALWDVTESTRHMDVTLFWCVGKLDQGCESDLTWSTLPANMGQFDISLPNSNLDDKLFGISVTDVRNPLASGIFWTKCIFDARPDTLKLNSMNVYSTPEGLTVTWEMLDCTYQTRTKVTQYIVKWCQTSMCNDSQQINTKNVSAKEGSYQVSSLTANVDYSFTVLPESSGMLGEEFTPWMVAAHILATSDFPWNVFAGVIVALFCAAAVLGLVICLYRKCITGRDNVRIFSDEQLFDMNNVLVPNPGKTLATPLVTPTTNPCQPSKTDNPDIVKGEITSHGSSEEPEHFTNYIRLAGKPETSEEGEFNIFQRTFHKDVAETNRFSEPSVRQENETGVSLSEPSDRQENETMASSSECSVCPESDRSSSGEQNVTSSYMAFPGLKMNDFRYQDYSRSSIEREEL